MINELKKKLNQLYFKDTSFVDLMTKRIFNVLLVANPYDAFMLEDDGRIDEKIFNEYMNLSLRYPPRFTQVSTMEEAWQKLAKMNLLLNNVRGEITEANSFYSDPYNAVGQFDYVMANPPFNVDEVVFDKVKDDARFNTYGVPRNKSKSTKKDSDKKETVPNANYLWIGYFATALKETGKAALVMANSASDAGGSEYEIRKKLIEEGDKQKCHTDKKDEILFIDARNVFTQVDRAHRKFSDEQIKNLGIITKLYNGDEQAFVNLIEEYKANLEKAPEVSDDKEIMPKSYWQTQIDWLNERFPEGKYHDVIGLCKAAKLDGEDGIIDHPVRKLPDKEPYEYENGIFQPGSDI